MSMLYLPSFGVNSDVAFLLGYENGSGNWDEHSNYVNANNLHVIPPVSINIFVIYVFLYEGKPWTLIYVLTL